MESNLFGELKIELGIELKCQMILRIGIESKMSLFRFDALELELNLRSDNCML